MEERCREMTKLCVGTENKEQTKGKGRERVRKREVRDRKRTWGGDDKCDKRKE